MKTICLPLIGAMLLLVGCQAQSMTPPPGFVAVADANRGIYDYRAVSADGAVVAVRTQPNPNGADLAFWSKASTSQLQEKGYKLQHSEDIATPSGLKGQLLEFTQTRAGTPYTYLLAIFVRQDKVVLTEAGGKAEQLQPLRDEIKKSLLSVK